MLGEVKSKNSVDVNGNPTGGAVSGVGLEIKWQKGPLGRGDERKEPNGAFVETVIDAAMKRLCFYQSTKFNCKENALAITRLEEALYFLNSRTQRREGDGVEGTHSGR